MKRVLCLLLFAFSFFQSYATADFFEYYLNTKLNSTFKNHGDYGGGTSLNGSFLGTISSISDVLVIDLVGTKTYQNGTDNISATRMMYRIYKGTPSGTFTSVNLPFLSETSGSNPKDKTWNNGSQINLLAGLTAIGTYTVEVYFEGDGTWSGGSYSILRNNGGANYKATFDITTVLNVEVSNFYASYFRGNCQLNWQTTSEKNNVQFNIQRSPNNQTWQTIGQVKATNNPNGAKYNYVDDTPLSNINYYRLQMVDNDGKMTYSKVVAVSAEGGKKSLAVFPNPVKSELNLLTDGNTQGVSIFDMTGRAVRQFNDNRTKVNVADLPNGVYFVRLMDKNGWAGEPVRFVKQ